MSQRGLEALLRPKSIAVIGASPRPERAGYLMMRNLLAGGFSGAVLPVTPKYQAVCGVMTCPDIASLPLSPDLAIICTHARRNLTLLTALGERGCRACIILSAPVDDLPALQACASRWHIRLLGPNSLGLLAPWQGLNASFSPVPIRPGRLAFISQSAAVSNTILDWAQQRQLGFSWFISLGDGVDIDSDDLLDFLARDSKSSAILLYLENLSDARRFVSAARSAARNKPILVIKSGRSPQAQKLLKSRGGMDAAWDAAIQRAGMLRVHDTHELFSAVETLSHMRPLRGERLMIISNGAAPAALALDALDARNGRLAELSEPLLEQLTTALGQNISAGNPLNLQDDATPERYILAIRLLADSHDIDALLIIYAPSAVAPAAVTASLIIEQMQQHPRARQLTLLSNWCGEYSSLQARQLFSAAKIPTYRTPEGAVKAFMHMVEYRRNQKQLRETPALPVSVNVDHVIVHRLINQALQAGETTLENQQVLPVLQACGMEIIPDNPALQPLQELRIVVQEDAQFGPVIMLGEGGVSWQDEHQAAVALPPLNMTLARYLIKKTLGSGKIRHRTLQPLLDVTALSRLLVQISDLIVDCPEIVRLDMQPVCSAAHGFTLNDATIHLAPFSGNPTARLAIRPYPRELEEPVCLKNDLHCLFRPVLPEDEPLLKSFIGRVTKEDLYYRYFSEINEFTHDDLANMTQIDYDREMAIVAVRQYHDRTEIIGISRAISDADNIDAEFSVLVRSDLKGIGLGRRLLEKMIAYTREQGLQQLNGITMPGNTRMTALARKLGFAVETQLEDGIVSLSLALQNAAGCSEK